jgi:hypothetical protein
MVPCPGESSVWNGKTVLRVRRLTEDELVREGWQSARPVMALEFTDGSLVYASCDSEGYGPGALFARNARGETQWVLPDAGAQ